MISSTSSSGVVSATATVPARRPSRRHGHAVADLDRLVEVVRHQQDARAVVDERAHQPEEPLDPQPGKERGRLVEHQYRLLVLALAQLLDRAHDRQQRALHLRECAHRRGGIDAVQAVTLQDRGGMPALLAPADRAPAAGPEAGDHEVLAHRQLGHEPEILVDEGQAEAPERPGRQRQIDGRAAQRELTGIGLVEAREHLQQRGLPRAVLPQQTVHLGGEQLQVDVGERLHAAEALAEPGELEQRPPAQPPSPHRSR
jgi:hypothetical protein